MTVKRYGTGLNGRIEEMECGAFTGYAEYSALLKERDALVVENAGLKGFGERLSEMRNDLNGTGTGIHGCHEAHIQQVALEAAVEAFDELETPATDAAIANIQAQGAEMAGGRLRQFIDELDFSVAEIPLIAGCIDVAANIAAQLRKGGAHD